MNPARRALDAALADEPALAGWRMTRVLRDRPPVLVARLERGDAFCAVKLWTQARATEAVALARRLDSARLALAGSPHQVVAVQLLLPERGLLTMDWQEGEPMTPLLAGPRRAAVLRAAAGWHAALSAGGGSHGQPGAHAAPQRGAFAPQWWLSRLDRQHPGGWAGPEVALRQRLAAMVPALRGASFLRGLRHGDFTPDNLAISPGGAVCAIDLSAGVGPVLHDLARMRAWLGSRSGARHWRADRAALTPPELFNPADAPVLAFLTGLMLLDYSAAARHRPDRLALLAEAGSAWLAETAPRGAI